MLELALLNVTNYSRFTVNWFNLCALVCVCNVRNPQMQNRQFPLRHSQAPYDAYISWLFRLQQHPLSGFLSCLMLNHKYCNDVVRDQKKSFVHHHHHSLQRRKKRIALVKIIWSILFHSWKKYNPQDELPVCLWASLSYNSISIKI